MIRRLATAAVIAVLGFGSSTLAQTAAVTGSDPSRAATLLPGSAAFADEATALVYNPAGLSHVGLLNGAFIHERSNTRFLDNNSLFLASSLGDVVGLGASLEWISPMSGAAQRAKSSLGFSLGSPELSLGLGLHWFYGGPTEGMLSADLGLQALPLRWLSLGAMVRNLNAPVQSSRGVELPREWVLGLGLRPLGERVSVGVDWFAAEKAPLAQSRMQYTISAEAVKGLRLLGGVSHGFDATTPLVVHAGLGIDLEHFGYTQGVAFAGEDTNYQFAARFSVEKYPSIVPKKKIAILELEGVGSSPGQLLGSLLGLAAEDRYLRLLRSLELAARDPELEAIVLKVEGTGLGFARADELRSSVLRLRAAKKKVFAYVLSAGDAEYLIASACDAIYAAPEAMYLVDGLRSSVTFFGGAAEKLDVTVDVARVGAFKNFPDQFTRTGMSAEQKEALGAYLDTTQRTVERRILEQRPKLTAEAWRASIEEGLKSVKRAEQLGQLDGVVDPKAFEEVLRAAVPGAAVDRTYRPRDTRDVRWGTPTRIAIVPVLGGIAGGKSGVSPLTGQSAGAETFVEAMNSAAEDSSVAAIVVRIDSGGGEVLASYFMYRSVLEAKKKKPVVVSMGDVAASGGYYVAVGADEIWASPTTLTGSIGVFFMKPAIKGLAERFGVTQESLERGKNSGLTEIFDPWTADQRVIAQKYVDESYDLFITEVAANRHLSKDDVDKIARGRIWSGEDALARHLVDNLGGLMDAVKAAKTRANLGDRDDVELALWNSRGGVVRSLLSGEAARTLVELPLPQPAQPLLPLLRALGPDAWLLAPPAVQARLEYSVSVQ